jgi:hypothetical protein
VEFVWTVPATVVRVVDGDTIEVHLDLGWRVYRNNEHLGINGLWSPERRTRAGRKAKAYAESLLPPGTEVLGLALTRARAVPLAA